MRERITRDRIAPGHEPQSQRIFLNQK